MSDIESARRRDVLLGLASLALSKSAGAQQPAPERREIELPRYDQDYPVVGYSRPATRNRIWRLRQRLASGETVLKWEAKGGYLRSLLAALEIEIDSQVVVFSKTSLQTDLISERTPRALYFNDDTYVGHIPGSRHAELTSIDAELGPVFYALLNEREQAAAFTRYGGACLVCHDTFSMTGGGIPRLLALSVPVDDRIDARQIGEHIEVDDRTPLEQRWGGWYVTGRHGRQSHLGNLPVKSRENEPLRSLPRTNRQSLSDYFDTSGYLTDTSDIVALMVLEHQKTVQNEITRASFKIRTALARFGDGGRQPSEWADIGARHQQLLNRMIQPLIRALLMIDAAPLRDTLVSSSGFAARFAALGPRSSKGRSLRELDLKSRLFRYPLSYLIYSAAFDGLPDFVSDLVRREISDVLSGVDAAGLWKTIAAADRNDIADILTETKPGFLTTNQLPPSSRK